MPATLLLRLFRMPLDPQIFRVFDPKSDARHFKDGVVYSCKQWLPCFDANAQKPLLFMLLHPLLQFICVDLARRDNGTSSINSEYVFNSISAADGGFFVRLAEPLFPFQDPIDNISKNLGDLSIALSKDCPISASSVNRIRPLKKGRLTRASGPVYNDEYEEQKIRLSDSVEKQFKVKSNEFLTSLHTSSTYLTVSGSDFSVPSTGLRTATSVVGLCIYEINRFKTLDSVSLYMHVTLLLADRLTKSSGVLSLILCLRLARRLHMSVVLEAVDRRQLSDELKDDLIGLYKKFGFLEMDPLQVSSLCEKPEKGIVFMILPPEFIQTPEIEAYEKYLLSLISATELHDLESESAALFPRVFEPSRVVTHNESDDRTKISIEQVTRIPGFPSATEFFRTLVNFSKKKPLPRKRSDSTVSSERPQSPFLPIAESLSASSSSSSSSAPSHHASRILHLVTQNKLESAEARLATALSVFESEKAINALREVEIEKERAIFQEKFMKLEMLQQEHQKHLLRAEEYRKYFMQVELEREKERKELDFHKVEREKQRAEYQSHLLERKAEQDQFRLELEAAKSAAKELQAMAFSASASSSASASASSSSTAKNKKRNRTNDLSGLSLCIVSVKSDEKGGVHIRLRPLALSSPRADPAAGADPAAAAGAGAEGAGPEECRLLLDGKFASLNLRSHYPGLFNPVQVTGSSIECTESWKGEIIRQTFNDKNIYKPGVTPLDVSRKQNLRGFVEKVKSEYVLTARTTMDSFFGRSRFRIFFNLEGTFLRGCELRLLSDDEVGWIEEK